jgi:hypothetical protein
LCIGDEHGVKSKDENPFQGVDCENYAFVVGKAKVSPKILMHSRHVLVDRTHFVSQSAQRARRRLKNLYIVGKWLKAGVHGAD